MNDNAISHVIGVVLMIAVVIICFAIVSQYALKQLEALRSNNLNANIVGFNAENNVTLVHKGGETFDYQLFIDDDLYKTGKDFKIGDKIVFDIDKTSDILLEDSRGRLAFFATMDYINYQEEEETPLVFNLLMPQCYAPANNSWLDIYQAQLPDEIPLEWLAISGSDIQYKIKFTNSTGSFTFDRGINLLYNYSLVKTEDVIWRAMSYNETDISDWCDPFTLHIRIWE